MAPAPRRADADGGPQQLIPVARVAVRWRAHAVRGSAALVVLAALLFVAPASAIETPATLGPCGPIARRHDYVELTAAGLRKLGRTPLERIGMMALRDGALVPIPFQIDEREGRTIAMPNGPEPSTDSKPGVLDLDDVVVVLPCDAGAHATAAELEHAVPGLVTWREIELRDPLDGAHAFAYLVVADRPPTTSRHYVSYEPAADLVATAAYRVGMVRALPTYFAIAMTGPLGPNLLDGIRLRADATLLASLAHFHLDETDARHALMAWKAGPVRVVRRSRHDVKVLGLPIPLQAGIANTAFYPLVAYGPGALHLPISPGVLFRDIAAMGGLDARDLRGWRFVAPGTPPGGFAIDGEMDAAERAYAATGTWFVLVHGDEALLVVVTLSENLARAIPLEIVYVDDARRDAPPEHERGSVPLAGFRGRHIERLPADRYRFDLRVYLLPGYRAGDEMRVMRERETPLAVTINAPEAHAAAPASTR